MYRSTAVFGGKGLLSFSMLAQILYTRTRAHFDLTNGPEVEIQPVNNVQSRSPATIQDCKHVRPLLLYPLVVPKGCENVIHCRCWIPYIIVLIVFRRLLPLLGRYGFTFHHFPRHRHCTHCAGQACSISILSESEVIINFVLMMMDFRYSICKITAPVANQMN